MIPHSQYPDFLNVFQAPIFDLKAFKAQFQILQFRFDIHSLH
jgi:hypothetical protein